MVKKIASRRKGANDKKRGYRVVNSMARAKLTRDRCAIKTGISQGILTKIRAGEDCWLSEFIALSTELSVSMDTLAGLDEHKNEALATAELLQSLPDDVRKNLTQLIVDLSSRLE